MPAESLCIFTDHSVTIPEILSWETTVLDILKWDLSSVTSYSILDTLLRNFELETSSGLKMETVRKHAETFVALASTEHVFSQNSPALIAVSSICAALRGLNFHDVEELIHFFERTTGVPEGKIKECMEAIEKSISLSLNGTSFQPNQPLPTTTNSQRMKQTPSIMVNNNNLKEDGSESKTPTDVIDAAAVNYVY